MGTIILIIALIALAMFLILMEILTPSFGVLGLMGAGALIGAVVTGFSLHASVGWFLLIGLVVATPIYIFLLIKWLPSSRLGKQVFLGKAPSGSGEGTPQAAGLEALIGSEGVAATDLRPAGKIRIDGCRIEARAESTVIDRGKPVRVIDATGTEVVVREIEPATGEAGQTEQDAPDTPGENEE